jgi:hypothetical protein|tara:strand:+ start:864 stop:1238 length:375 start_codon:yes stop_codon:yes gene_type:complete
VTEVDALGAWVPVETEDIKNSELWSLDATLTDLILPRIKAFRKMERHGYPILGKEIAKVDDDSAGEELKEAEWENILFDIEKGFEAHKELTAANFVTHTEEHLAEETMQKGLRLFAEHYGHLWD